MSDLAHRTIQDVRPMTPEELEAEGWSAAAWECPIVLVLDDGTKLYAARDPEGNGPGALFGADPQGRSFRIVATLPT